MEKNKRGVSAIIVTYFSSEDVVECIKELNSGKRTPDEIIVVNNGDVDPLLISIAENSDQVRVINSDRNIGFGAGVNLGLRHAACEYIFVLNPDVRANNDGLSSLCKCLDNDNKIAILGPRVLNPDGKVQQSARRYPTPLTYFFHRNSLFYRLFPNNPFSKRYLEDYTKSERITSVDWVSGCCFIARKSSLESINGFDEEFFLFLEDTDLCKRMNSRQAGSVRYCPWVEVTHTIGISNEKRNFLIEKHRFESIRHYIKKHFARENFILKGMMKAVVNLKLLRLNRKVSRQQN